MMHRILICCMGLILVQSTLPRLSMARETWKCWLIAGAELLIPGAGYLIMQDFDKAATFGLLRHVAANNVRVNAQHPEYIDDPDEIYQTRTADGEEHLDIFLNRPTFYADTSASIYSNLTFSTFFDLYDGNCEENPETYQRFADPFRFNHFGTDWKFWVPIAYIGAFGDNNDFLGRRGTNVTYYTDDLSREEMRSASFINFQLVGIGEELLFRGLIQRSIFEGLHKITTERWARFGGVVLGAAIFGLAHNGQGLSSNSAAAFWAGFYLGYLYHPAPGVFDLRTPIALHSWWDTILVDRILNESEFNENVDVAFDEDQQRIQVQQERTIPLLSWGAQF